MLPFLLPPSSFRLIFMVMVGFYFHGMVLAQTIKGVVRDAGGNKEPLFGINIIEKGSNNGVSTDFNGKFELKPKGKPPLIVIVTGVGYEKQEIQVSNVNVPLKITLVSTQVKLKEVEIYDTRITEKQQEEPLTVESMNAVAIKQTSSLSFYEGLGNMKGVDITTASLGFKVINTRGFNSTSPVRSLQLIDGVDNMSPGLNFSLGNFLGASDLDVAKVDLIQGASSAFFGPNAFNGVLNMTTKSPFLFPGFSLSLKGGERNLGELALRWADFYKDKSGRPRFGYKLNAYYLQAMDWEAENYSPSTDSEADETNPGGYDAVNIYGDEALAGPYDFTSKFDQAYSPGLGLIYRSGYRERDLMDYQTQNIKANAGLHYLTKNKVEFILASSFGFGSTVYQGENRYRLQDVQFFQHRFEVQKENRFHLRLYATHEDAGSTYDVVATALEMLNNNIPTGNGIKTWLNQYATFYNENVIGFGYGPLYDSIPGMPNVHIQGPVNYNHTLANQLLADNIDLIREWHQMARNHANQSAGLGFEPYFQPGTPEFDSAFNSIINLPLGAGGSRLIDRSALFHADAGYSFRTSEFLDALGFKNSAPGFASIEWKLGGSFRLYQPNSQGTIFIDTNNRVITNWQGGAYLGMEKKWEKVNLNLTFRADKNENFDWLFSPAASVVYSPTKKHTLRFSGSWGVRNPTMADQFLNYDVGRARLVGNLSGRDSLISVDDFYSYLGSLSTDSLSYFNVDPVRPEQVRTLEIGYRGTLGKRFFIDGGAYFSWYTDFIGYQIGVDLEIEPTTQFPTNKTQAYRVATNSKDAVFTYGSAIQANYFLGKYYTLSGNYSWNVLNRLGSADPLIPAFNTPEHKFNIGFEGRDIDLDLGFLRLKNWGFNVNFKWIEGFLFEGSPQFTGAIPSYYLLDAQLNYRYPKWHTTLKIGAQNLTDNRVVQVYGGPQIGRIAYISLLFDMNLLNR